jgi:hypothetical protein
LEALTLAASWPVLPLDGKRPFAGLSVADGSRDLAQIGKWWQRWPGANIGGVCGEQFIAIDIDPRHGSDVSALDDPLPPTCSYASGGADGGSHLIYRIPGNVVGELHGRKLAPGIDARGQGQYIVLSGIHPDTLAEITYPHGEDIADAPAWIIERMQSPSAGTDNELPEPIDESELDGFWDWAREEAPNEDCSGQAFHLVCRGIEKGRSVAEIRAALRVHPPSLDLIRRKGEGWFAAQEPKLFAEARAKARPDTFDIEVEQELRKLRIRAEANRRFRAGSFVAPEFVPNMKEELDASDIYGEFFTA